MSLELLAVTPAHAYPTRKRDITMIHDLFHNIAIARGRMRGLQRRTSLLALCLMLAACGSGSSGTTAGSPPTSPPPQKAELYQGDSFVPELASSNSGSCYRFTDPTRGNRALSVQLRIPSDAPGARPVIVFSHGGGPRSACSFGNAQWGDALASAGYVVIHIAHSINAVDREMACSAMGVPGCSEVMAMLYLRPGDISAVISQIPAIATRFGLSERIDASRLGVAGHSFGAYTVMTAVGAKVELGVLRGKSFVDSRIVSAMALSPQGTGRFGFYDQGGDEHSWANISLPVLTQTGLGDGDPLTGEAGPDRRIPFEKMPAPDKMEAFLNEPRAIHGTFNLNSNAPTEFHDWIRATGIAWFDATLQQRDTARAWLASDALVQVSDGLVEVSRK
jgi:predicted dienelactone hydrolase